MPDHPQQPPGTNTTPDTDQPPTGSPRTFTLPLPRYDLDWRTKKKPRQNKKTGKPEWPRHRPVWDVLWGNARPGHTWRPRARATRQVIADVTDIATLMKVPTGSHLTVELTWAPGRATLADADNLWHLQKVMCDALARGRNDIPGLRLVPDDRPKYMTKKVPVIAAPDIGAGLWLTVTVMP